MFNTPILYLIFNRPDLTEITFPSICKLKPKKLFIAADGPRLDNKTDEINCKFVREFILSKIDWNCEVKTLFRDENLGCGKAVSSAITWFFDQVDYGIILEDDCVPNQSFFEFSEQLLTKYKFNDKIMHISGNSFLSKNIGNDSYYFSKFPFIWGWATWKRAWNKYNYMYHNLGNIERNEIIDKNFENPLIAEYWKSTFEKHLMSNIDMTWDYQWFFSIWINNGLVILPKFNLVKNIGFGRDATHTNIDYNSLSNYISKGLRFPLNHPVKVEISKKFENLNFKRYFKKKVPLYQKIKLKITKLIREIFKKILVNLIPESKILFKKNSCLNDFFEREVLYTNKVKLNRPYSIHHTSIGDYTYISTNSSISFSEIGKYCSIGPNLFCGAGIHPINGISTSPMFYSTMLQNGSSLSISNKIEERKKIKIGNDVFIGANVTILDGIEIGDGAVIGAGSVVSKNIPPYSVAVGSPIRIIKKRFEDKIIHELLNIKWWDWDQSNIKKVEKYFFDMDSFFKSVDN
jgi:acetyltransferase-like isoleucine patch superfamily enzyme